MTERTRWYIKKLEKEISCKKTIIKHLKLQLDAIIKQNEKLTEELKNENN